MSHGNLIDYRTGNTVRPATREEREWSLDAMLEGDTGVFALDGVSYYVEGEDGVECVDDRYTSSGCGSFTDPAEFLDMVRKVWDEELELTLRDDGWHGPNGLLLVLA